MKTKRLEIVAATAAMLRAEMEDRERFASLLEAEIPRDWPPVSTTDAIPFFLGALEEHPEWREWLTRYVVLREGARRVLVGGVGFLGGPDRVGMVEIGYSIIPAFQGRGIAGEMVDAMVRWAFEQKGVTRVEAETQPSNAASWALLSKLGFRPIGGGREAGSRRLRLAANAVG